MSGLNYITTQDSIAAYIAQEFPNYDIYDNDVVDDDFILKTGNKVKPYIVLNWGGLNPVATNGSFVGARNDEYYSTVDVSIVAPTSRQARLALNIVLDKLVGWKPQDSTPMSIAGAIDVIGIPDYDGKPNVYFASQRLRYNLNTTSIGEPIQS
jgi:hypothetical protein